jgi:hypothetical protein
MNEQPIIIAGTTDNETRFVHYWTEHERIAGRDVTFCRASLLDGNAYAPDLIRIARGCPPAWIDRILADFAVFRFGGEIEPTHTVIWTYGEPTFTTIAQPAADEELALFELPESSVS